jgi:hypothetical protein
MNSINWNEKFIVAALKSHLIQKKKKTKKRTTATPNSAGSMKNQPSTDTDPITSVEINDE